MGIDKSSYLSDITLRYASDLAALPASDHQALQSLIEKISLLSLADTHEQLRPIKALFSFRWANARLNQSLSNTLLGELQTAFAEATIDKALKATWALPQFEKIVPQSKRYSNGTVPGLFILGLGKLGGYDLNFSSDVDLIAFYDANTLPVASMHGRTDLCTRVLKEFTKILSSNINGEFVWRVDWRLRPHAASPSLVLEKDVALDFYFFHSMPWHRLAMTKARVIAGDINIGDEFLNDLTPYIWRQNLDYQMVDEIFKLKSKINREHPSLKKARIDGTLRDSNHGAGFNLKLGRGGIREIEFIVNAQQLLWGGKKPLLRLKPTTQLLQQLENFELLDVQKCKDLIDAYEYFRRLEDSLQILDNKQEHIIPVNEDRKNKLLAILNIDENTLWSKLCHHRQNVISHFDNLFTNHNDEATLDGDLENNPDWVETLPEKQLEIWESWSQGFQLYAVSASEAPSLQKLLIILTRLLSNKEIDRVHAISTLHHFFQSIPKGGQYLRLLIEQANLQDDIILPLLHSPHMTHLLEQSPHIVDLLLEPSNDISQPNSIDFHAHSQFVLHTEAYDLRLERLRRFVNEQLYVGCLFLMQGKIGAKALSQRLTSLAEHTLSLGISITNHAMQLDETPLVVIGMGKLGMCAMAPMSDLDLIFVAKNDMELDFVNQYSNRLQHVMDTRTKEGRAYEMDMRLRPSGRSGPPTVSLKSFEHYHQTRAKTWEHIALTAARPVAGPSDLIGAINDIRSKVMTEPRNIKQLKLDAAKMLWRLQSQRLGKSDTGALDVKLDRGGLMELDYLSACTVLLAQVNHKDSQLPYDEIVSNAFESEANNTYLQGCEPKKLFEATHFWRKLQIWCRVFGIQKTSFSEIKTPVRENFLKDMEAESLAELTNKVNETRDLIKTAVDAMQYDFEKDKPGDWKEWEEKPVSWIK